MKLNTTEELIDDIRQGKMIVLMDDEDRENEGDLVMAASCVTPESINFMVKNARGLVCMPMTHEKCQALKIPLMSMDNGSKFGTSFTVSIEAAHGVTTGISAHDRAKTIQVAANMQATEKDIVQPGHIFPIRAQQGGVLARAGHTEASVDFAMLAGCGDTAVICEILKEDGTMARLQDCVAFAKEHDLKIGTIANLIDYRLNREKTIAPLTKGPIETAYGQFEIQLFRDLITNDVHMALCHGEFDKQSPTPCRVQQLSPVYDLPGILRGQYFPASQRWPLAQSMQMIANLGKGVIVLLHQPFSAEELIEEVGMLNCDKKAEPTRNENHEWRQIGVGSQILAHLGLGKLRILGTPKKYHALSGFGLEVVEYLPFTQTSEEASYAND